jgi:hypothetical protein
MGRRSRARRRVTGLFGKNSDYVLSLERLEDRLTLSQNAPALAYEMPLVVSEPAPDLVAAHFGQSETNNYGTYAAPRAAAPHAEAHDAGADAAAPATAGYLPGGAVFSAPALSDGFRPFQQAYQPPLQRPAATDVEVVLVFNVSFVSPAGTQNGGLEPLDTYGASSAASAPPADGRASRASDATPAAGSAGYRAGQSSPVLAADSLAHAGQYNNDSAKANNSALPLGLSGVGQQPALAPNAPNVPADLALSRPQGTTALIPQAGIELVQPPDTRFPRWQTEMKEEGAAASPEVADERSGFGNIVASVSDNASTGGKELVTQLVKVTLGDRGALLADLRLNMEAVDQALAAMVSEIESLGGQLVSWFDEANLSTWGTASAMVAAIALGSRYVWRGRGWRSLNDDAEEESSSWLFTRLQNPAGHS